MQGSWLCNLCQTDLMVREMCFYEQLSLNGGVMMGELPIVKDDDYARPC
jgi:hypothetical protein